MESEEVVRYLHNLKLPASKNEVVHAAKKNGAPKDMWKALDKQLPWTTYQHVDDILKAMGLPPHQVEGEQKIA